MESIAINPWAISTGLLGVLVSVMAWIGKRHLREDDRRAERLAQLEIRHASREDLQRVEGAVSELRDTVANNHQEVLKILLDRR